MTDDPGQDEELEAVAPDAAAASSDSPSGASDIAELLALIDRLEPMLEASGLEEIEIAAGDTTVVLRAPTVGIVAAAMPAIAPTPTTGGTGGPTTAPATDASDGLRQIKAPLTGLFYLSPSPGAAAYVKVGGEVNSGQVIGLLEAMKLFNEIKSDVTGVVRRIVAENGALVKTHQVLIEVEPT